MSKTSPMCCEEMYEKLQGNLQFYSSDKAVCKENGKQLRFDQLRNRENPKSYCLVEMDKAIDSQYGGRPDVLVRICEENRFYFVELKGDGTDARQAVENQIIPGILFAKSKGLAIEKDKTYAVVVGGRIPAGLEWKKMQSKFVSKHGQKLTRTRNSYSIPISET